MLWLPLKLPLTVGGSIPEPSRDLLYQAKVNYNFNAKHTAFLRFDGETAYLLNDYIGTSTGLPNWSPNEDKDTQLVYNAVFGETFIVSPTTVNQFTAQWMNFKHDSHFAPCPINVPYLGINSCLGYDLSFPSVTALTIPNTDLTTWEHNFEFRDDISKQIGRHALKFGGDYT